MAATKELLTIIENCRISPPANTVGERTLPLTYFDFAWLLSHPVHQLFFYKFHHSKSHFIQNIIPNLKHSLSITFQHFFPFAGNLIVFPNDDFRKPEIRHVDGDAITLTFVECYNLDFDDLVGDHPRDCNKFHPLVPLLDGAYKISDFVKIPIFSIQVTVFPNVGITIGLTNHHALCDARTRYNFLMAWTSIAKSGTDELLLTNVSNLPFYDRVIEYPNSLDEFFLKIPMIRNLDENYVAPQLVSQDRARATFVLTRKQINGLKKWLLGQVATLEHVSSFTIVCGYVWSCIAKSRVRVVGENGVYEVERFGCVADWRGRLDPPVPQTYFGNCWTVCGASTKTSLLIGKIGFCTGVELLGNAISETIKNKKDMFKNVEDTWETMIQPFPTIGTAGTPKLNVYDVDFGWGKPKKHESISLDFGDSISVNCSKDSSQDLEIGLCLGAQQMDAFIDIFRNELESMLSEQE